MTLSIQSLHPIFAASVEGVDLRVDLAPSVAAEIEAAMDRFGVLVFPGQDIRRRPADGVRPEFRPAGSRDGDGRCP